jgi:acyl-CoA thioester hydrolase
MSQLKSLRYEDYPVRTFDKVRYSDTDRQGHINNAVFSVFLETGRVEVLYNPENPLYDKDSSFVIVNINLSLLAEIKWPGIVEIGSAVLKLGNSSINFVQGLYQNNQLVATAETIIVHVDNTTKRSKPLSKETRILLNQYHLKKEII